MLHLLLSKALRLAAGSFLKTKCHVERSGLLRCQHVEIKKEMHNGDVQTASVVWYRILITSLDIRLRIRSQRKGRATRGRPNYPEFSFHIQKKNALNLVLWTQFQNRNHTARSTQKKELKPKVMTACQQNNITTPYGLNPFKFMTQKYLLFSIQMIT